MGLWGILTSVFPLHVLNEHYHESTRSLALCSRQGYCRDRESTVGKVHLNDDLG